MADTDWEQRVAAAWASIDDLSETDFVNLIAELAAELAPNDAIGLFERAGSFDSTGRSDLAVPLYREALRIGLTGVRRRQAEESVAILTDEVDAASDDLDDAVKAVLALSLADTGREREGLSVALTALAPHLSRYQRSMANYARLLIEPET
jgi:hypothetical protein